MCAHRDSKIWHTKWHIPAGNQLWVSPMCSGGGKWVYQVPKAVESNINPTKQANMSKIIQNPSFRACTHRKSKFGTQSDISRPEIIFGCPRCLRGVINGYIKSQKHLQATLTPQNEQKRAKIVRNPSFRARAHRKSKIWYAKRLISVKNWLRVLISFIVIFFPVGILP